MQRMHASIAPWEISERFSVEDIRSWNNGCLGFHKPGFPVSRMRWETVLDWCPEVLLILPIREVNNAKDLFGEETLDAIIDSLSHS